MYQLRYTPLARKDLETIWDDVYNVSKDINVADKYVSEFINKIADKKEFPTSGIPLTYKGLFTGFYSVNYKIYKAFYRINCNYIEVIRIILSKKDYMIILFGDSNNS